MVIPDPDSPTRLSPLLAPTAFTEQKNSQQGAIRIQVPLYIVQQCLSKEESGELINQRDHIFTSTQELQHSPRNFVWV